MGQIINNTYVNTDNTSLLGDKIYFLESICQKIVDLGLDGSVAELGVYKGGSARLIATAFPSKPVYLFDSFAGMIEDDSDIDGKHKKNDFNDVTYDMVRQYLSDKPNCLFYKGWFPETAKFLTTEKFCLVHLDGDYYQSTVAGIEVFWNRMVPGGVIIFDDIDWFACPGVRRAVDEFFTDKVKHVREMGNNSCAIFKPLI